MNDIKYAVRAFLRTPGFTRVAVATLALGIGATTAIFTIVNAVLLNPLPYTAAERLVFLSDELAKRSLESLAQSIRAAVGDTEAVRIQVRGPQSLFETLQAALGERGGSFDYVEAPGLDLIVSIDGNLFETRLSEWAGAMQEILS